MLNGGHMTPEERYKRIDERLDAIARNVELLSGLQMETEKSLNNLVQTVARLVAVIVTHDERLDQLEGNQPQ
jgi:hypothetical protein